MLVEMEFFYNRENNNHTDTNGTEQTVTQFMENLIIFSYKFKQKRRNNRTDFF